MKKGLVMLAGLLLFSCTRVYALDTRLLEERNRIFEESKKIQFFIPVSQDGFVLYALWDSSVLTVTQLNAYFYMMGIFESLQRDTDTTNDRALLYLTSWLEELRRTNFLNMKNLDELSRGQIKDEKTRGMIDNLKKYFTALDQALEAELGKTAVLKRARVLGKK